MEEKGYIGTLCSQEVKAARTGGRFVYGSCLFLKCGLSSNALELFLVGRMLKVCHGTEVVNIVGALWLLALVAGGWQSANPFPLLPSSWPEWKLETNPLLSSCSGCAICSFIFFHSTSLSGRTCVNAQISLALSLCCRSAVLPELWHLFSDEGPRISYTKIRLQSCKTVFTLFPLLSFPVTHLQDRTTFLASCFLLFYRKSK